jgi:hypothetical protein
MATGGANARNGVDYSTIALSATIPSYQGSVTVTVIPTDPLRIPSLAFESPVSIAINTNASIYTVGTAASATVYIADPTFPVSTGPTPAPSGLVGYWRGEGNWNDDSTGLHTAVPQNGLTFCPSVVGQAFNFDGIDDRLNVADTSSLNFGANQDFSIETWIRPIAATTDYGVQSIVDKRYAPNDWTSIGYALSLVNGQLCCQLGVAGSGANFGPSGPDLRDGKFHHVAMSVVRNSTTGANLYVDGASILTFNPTGSSGSLSNAEPFRIGNHATSYRNCYGKGPIDEVSLYNRALTISEIGSVYNAGRAGKCIGPTIVTTPQNQTVNAGASATFSVSLAASGCAAFS